MKITERVSRKRSIKVSCVPFTNLPKTVTCFEENYPIRWKMTDDNVLTSRDSDILHGDLCIKGTRLPVSLFFEHLDDGFSIEEFMDWYDFPEKQILEKIKIAYYDAI